MPMHMFSVRLRSQLFVCLSVTRRRYVKLW